MYIILINIYVYIINYKSKLLHNYKKNPLYKNIYVLHCCYSNVFNNKSS